MEWETTSLVHYVDLIISRKLDREAVYLHPKRSPIQFEFVNRGVSIEPFHNYQVFIKGPWFTLEHSVHLQFVIKHE